MVTVATVINIWSKRNILRSLNQIRCNFFPSFKCIIDELAPYQVFYINTIFYNSSHQLLLQICPQEMYNFSQCNSWRGLDTKSIRILATAMNCNRVHYSDSLSCCSIYFQRLQWNWTNSWIIKIVECILFSNFNMHLLEIKFLQFLF